ncbi:TetR/AcrR family transcriptional regulator [[Mycobacterium] wendilense]|uniref:TetR/AcrR family transcriptional regulator n=1 Tax=[Mycobacterium] wendilense TaxID=3064284 RepID=A0ABM9MJM2_9MYCO|nr:TetR/AcrR family transcriptional regulator [Mycolicibacterium sp. MU0050]CAJ1586846.1 TetR/AcrR family transcriptional regulator [Mycolicibacterium sp. MU0050]
MTTPNSRRTGASDGGHLSRSDYFSAGMAILAEEGPRKLTTTNICSRIGATRGSFYHHFASGPAFISALIAHWEADVYARADEAASGAGDHIAAFKAAGVSAQHRAERAIRGWSYEDARVAAAQRRVDEFRQARLVGIFTELGVEPDTAATLADLGVALYAGVQVVDGFDRARRTAVVDVYDDLVRKTGSTPPAGPD